MNAQFLTSVVNNWAAVFDKLLNFLELFLMVVPLLFILLLKFSGHFSLVGVVCEFLALFVNGEWMFLVG